MQTVSCCDETRWCYVGQETICEQFPAAMKHNRAMPSRKPFTGCFPPTGIYEKIPHLLLLPRSFAVAQDDRWEAGRKSQNTVVSCRVLNPSRTVSYGGETQRSHAEQETIRKQFPAVLKHCIVMSNRKLYANSFLPRCTTILRRRAGNLFSEGKLFKILLTMMNLGIILYA
jgi:hypothetical protein